MSNEERLFAKEEVRLIPFKVKTIQANSNEYIPEGITMSHAPDQWLQGKDGSNVVVAVIDTGVDYYHPDLMGNILGGRDFTGKGEYMDGNGHGTHVAGTIAATSTGTGIVGMAPKVKILALKSLADNGTGYMQWTLDALRYAIDYGVDVINLSLGGAHMTRLHDLIKEATSKGIIVVAAAGNEGDGNEATEELSYPGAYPEVIQVGAVDINKQLAYFSNTNKEVDILAHGVNVLSTYPGGQYARLDGTSMATPHVAGAAALIKSLNVVDYHKGDKILDIATVQEAPPEPPQEPVDLVEPAPETQLPDEQEQPTEPSEPTQPEPEPEPTEPIEEEPVKRKPSKRFKRLLQKLIRHFHRHR